MDPPRTPSATDVHENDAIPAPPASRGSLMSARDAQFWVAVAIASCSGNSSVCSSSDDPTASTAGTTVDTVDATVPAFPPSSLTAASRTSSFVMSLRASALELRASMGDGALSSVGSTSSPRSRRQSTVWTLSSNSILNDIQELDFGLLIDGEAEEEEEDEEEDEEETDAQHTTKTPMNGALCPVTSPPPPEGGIRLPTRLHVHRLKRPESLSPTRTSTTSSASPPPPSSTVAPPPPPPPPPSSSSTRTPLRHSSSSDFEIAVDEIYENQRYQMVLGWGSKGHLLPLDPAKFVRVLRAQDPSDVLPGIAGTRTDWLDRRRRSLSKAVIGSPPRATAASTAAPAAVRYEHSPTFPDVPLPDAPSPHQLWEWISPWHLESPVDKASSSSPTSTSATVDATVDPDGWCYATSFHQFSGPSLDALASSPLSASPSVNSRGRPKLYVRRRKWIRYRRLRSITSSTSSTLTRASSAFDDAFLDSMRGWLWKRGHVRKNWKRRYFVLDKSVLRYYTDESATRLKGEVLLFHPSARVHYVDVHFAADPALPSTTASSITAPPAADSYSYASSAGASSSSSTSTSNSAVSRRELLFAVQVGPEYTLLLQAERLADREHWMYCIEDALLCRDSYLQDPERTQDVRESVARRRRFTAHGGGLAWLRPPLSTAAASRPTDAEAQATQHRLWRLLRACDALLESRELQHEMATFVAKYRQKYGVSSTAASSSSSSSGSMRSRSRGLSAALLTPARMCGPDETSARTRSSSLDVEDRSSPQLSTRKTAAIPERTACLDDDEDNDDDDACSTVAALQDARSQLALKSYRFFLERMIETVMQRLRALRPWRWRPRRPSVAAVVTSPRSASSVESAAEDGDARVDDSEDDADEDEHDDEDDGVDWELVRRAVLFRLERHVFAPLQSVIYALLEASVTPEDLSLFEANRAFLATQPQAFFDIAASHASPSEWRSARLLLDSVDDYSLPSEKAALLVQVAQCVYETFAREHPRSRSTSTLMAADDYLPIFIFVLARSRLRNVVVTRHVVSETMVSALMIGETGYYATMLEAAVSFIASQETTAPPDHHGSDPRVPAAAKYF